jgi:hypothetical protein
MRRTAAEAAISLTDCASAFVMMGVIRPPGVATAIDTSTVGFHFTLPVASSKLELAAGTARQARAAALMMTSLRENLAPVTSAYEPPPPGERVGFAGGKEGREWGGGGAGAEGAGCGCTYP